MANPTPLADLTEKLRWFEERTGALDWDSFVLGLESPAVQDHADENGLVRIQGGYLLHLATFLRLKKQEASIAEARENELREALSMFQDVTPYIDALWDDVFKRGCAPEPYHIWTHVKEEVAAALSSTEDSVPAPTPKCDCTGGTMSGHEISCAIWDSGDAPAPNAAGKCRRCGFQLHESADSGDAPTAPAEVEPS